MFEIGIMVPLGWGWSGAQNGLWGSDKILCLGLGVGYRYIHFVEFHVHLSVHMSVSYHSFKFILKVIITHEKYPAAPAMELPPTQ